MTLRSLLFAAVCAAPVAAQAGSVSVHDVGLTLDGGMLTVIYGQSCGPFSCLPFQAGPVGRGQLRIATVHGAPQQLFVLAVSLASIGMPCQPFPGFGNALILGQPHTLAIGVLGAPAAGTVCLQGRADYPLLLPPNAPVGVPFELQALAWSASRQQPAFTIALRATIQ